MTNTDDELRARRERLERLLAAADGVTRQRVPERPWWVPYALMGSAAAVVLVLMFVTGGGSGTGSASTTVLPTWPSPTATEPVVITLSPTTVPVVVPSTSAAGADTTVPASSATTWAPLPGQPVRWAVYDAGVITLQGAVPDEATSTKLLAHYATAVGVDRVIAAYVVAPGAPAVGDDVLTAPQAMHFDDGSSTLQPAATQFLDVVAALMAANQAFTVDIGAYTDDAGDDTANLALTQARVTAIVSYLQAAGVNPARLTGTGYGEQFPIASNASEQGRALNQRVEFTLHHLLD